jgi:hypothetical protein
MEVGLYVLDVTRVGTVFCGGEIGKGGKKMCVAIGCMVSSHVATKVVLDMSEHPMEEDFVFIPLRTKWRCLSNHVFQHQDWVLG